MIFSPQKKRKSPNTESSSWSLLLDSCALDKVIYLNVVYLYFAGSILLLIIAFGLAFLSQLYLFSFFLNENLAISQIYVMSIFFG